MGAARRERAKSRSHCNLAMPSSPFRNWRGALTGIGGATHLGRMIVAITDSYVHLADTYSLVYCVVLLVPIAGGILRLVAL